MYDNQSANRGYLYITYIAAAIITILITFFSPLTHPFEKNEILINGKLTNFVS